MVLPIILIGAAAAAAGFAGGLFTGTQTAPATTTITSPSGPVTTISDGDRGILGTGIDTSTLVLAGVAIFLLTQKR